MSTWIWWSWQIFAAHMMCLMFVTTPWSSIKCYLNQISPVFNGLLLITQSMPFHWDMLIVEVLCVVPYLCSTEIWDKWILKCIHALLIFYVKQCCMVVHHLGNEANWMSLITQFVIASSNSHLVKQIWIYTWFTRWCQRQWEFCRWWQLYGRLMLNLNHTHSFLHNHLFLNLWFLQMITSSLF